MKPVEIGQFRIRKFIELEGDMPVPAAAFHGLTPELLEQLKSIMDPRCFAGAPGTLLIAMQTYVLETKGARILIDTCNGNHKTRTGVMSPFHMLNSNYLGNLAALGLQPEDIDVVMCTHLHADHIGWNTKLENGKWVPTFPNAKYLISRLDYEAYANIPDDHHQSIIVREAFADSVLPVIAAGKAVMVDTGHVVEREVEDGVWLEGCPGHTPGTMMLHAKDGARHAVFTGDIFHHPVQITEPVLHIGADYDVDLARAARERTIARFVDTDSALFAAHFPDPCGGRIVSRGGRNVFRYLES